MCRLMAPATAAPPATASEPPSQKSFCTSTTIRAFATVTPSVYEDSAARRLAVRQLQPLPSQADQTALHPLAALLHGGRVGHGLSTTQERNLQGPVVVGHRR